MGIVNLNNQHLSETEKSAVNEALTALEKALSILTAKLTPEERSRYGRINEQNKLFVNKVKDFAKSQEALRVPEVDWDEFERDYNSREYLENVLNRLGNLEIRVQNAKILHDFDNYQDALSDYAYTSYRAKSKAAEYDNKYNELRQFFRRTKSTSSTPVEEKPQP